MTSATLECPLCGGRGSRRGLVRRHAGRRDRCRLCKGAGSVSRAVIAELIDRLTALADAMNAGDDRRAAREARRAGRAAQRLLGQCLLGD